MTQGYLIVAFGQRYIDESFHLYQTIRKSGDARPFSILTSAEDESYAKSLNVFDKVIILDTSDPMWDNCTSDFERYCLYPRITLNRYLVYDETINTDTDMLCQYSTDHVWTFCSNHTSPITTVGKHYDAEWHWGTISDVWTALGMHVPHVNGGFKYIRRGEFADRYYQQCQQNFWNYDSMGCKRWFRDSRTEEVIFAIAHSQMGIMPVEFREYPIQTFDYTEGMSIPSKMQHEGNGKFEMNGYPPFVHMTDKLHGKNFQWLFKTIMEN